MKLNIINRICLLGCASVALLAGAPKLHATAIAAEVFNWLPDDPTAGFSGTIMVLSPISGSGTGLSRLVAQGGVIIGYDILTPDGEFTAANSVLEGSGTVGDIYTTTWNTTGITSMQFEADKGSLQLFTTDSNIVVTALTDPTGHWVKPGANVPVVPDVTNSALLLALAGGALGMSRWFVRRNKTA